MLRINLLPHKKSARKKIRGDILFFVSLAVFFLGGLIAVHFYFSFQLNNVTEKVTELRQQKGILTSKVSQVNKISSSIQELDKKIDTIRSIRIRQGLPVQYVQEIFSNIPENRMWVETFSLDADSRITLSGVAFDNQTFANYVETLRASKYIASVNTQRTSRRTVEGHGLIFFQCAVTAKEYFPPTDTNGTAHD